LKAQKFWSNEDDFKAKTKSLAIKSIEFVATLPQNRAVEIISRQLLRSATSVGANYRAACRGKSVADVVSKLATVEEEADETLYWIELLVETGTVPREQVAELLRQADEIIAMTVASIRTMRKRL